MTCFARSSGSCKPPDSSPSDSAPSCRKLRDKRHRLRPIGNCCKKAPRCLPGASPRSSPAASGAVRHKATKADHLEKSTCPCAAKRPRWEQLKGKASCSKEDGAAVLSIASSSAHWTMLPEVGRSRSLCLVDPGVRQPKRWHPQGKRASFDTIDKAKHDTGQKHCARTLGLP